MSELQARRHGRFWAAKISHVSELPFQSRTIPDFPERQLPVWRQTRREPEGGAAAVQFEGFSSITLMGSDLRPPSLQRFDTPVLFFFSAARVTTGLFGM
jgi:hypothetical protein